MNTWKLEKLHTLKTGDDQGLSVYVIKANGRTIATTDPITIEEASIMEKELNEVAKEKENA